MSGQTKESVTGLLLLFSSSPSSLKNFVRTARKNLCQIFWI